MDYAYLAGFFDGEGCIGIYRNKGRTVGATLRVQLVQNDSPAARALLEEVQAKFKGNLTLATSANGNRKWNYQLSGLAAVNFLELITIHLRLKQTQAILAMAWYANRSPRLRAANGQLLTRTLEETELDDEIIAALKQMKKAS